MRWMEIRFKEGRKLTKKKIDLKQNKTKLTVSALASALVSAIVFIC